MISAVYNHQLAMNHWLATTRGVSVGQPHLIVEEVDGVTVEFEGEGLDEGDIVGENLFIREVQLQDNDGVDVIVGEKIVWMERERVPWRLEGWY